MFTFTTLGSFGQFGPASNRTYANYPWASDTFSIQNGIQQWIVPETGTYKVTAAGATSTLPGDVVTANLSLTQGQVVSILVGQMPTSLSHPSTITAGGGGGTYVMSGTTPLLTAIGGTSGSGTLVPGANIYSNGIVTNSIFPYTYPRSFVSGGTGSAYQYGNYSGGFGGGQTPIGVPIHITSIDSTGGLGLATTSEPHGYPIVYNVRITGTEHFDGVHQINTKSPTTFTFPFGSIQSDSGGIVTGLVSGASGGGGISYGGTNLGAISNTYGYVTIQYGPKPPILPWDGTKQWYSVANYPSNSFAKVWAQNKFISITSLAGPPIVGISTDGVNWTYPDTTGLPTDLYGSLATSLDQTIICTSNGYSSPDGINWTQTPNVPTWYINYLNGMFISPENKYLTGKYISTGVYTSTNGIVWNFIPTPSASLFSIEAFGNGTYVAIGGGSIYRSTNLSCWTFADSSTFWICIGFFNNLFVAGGSDNTIKTSPDGITWTSRFTSSLYHGWYCIQYVNSKILLFDYNIDPGGYSSCIESIDGITWNVIASNKFKFNNDTFGGFQEMTRYSGTVSKNICIVQAGGPVYITDGTNFVTSSNVLQDNPGDIVYSKELGIYVATTYNSVCTSRDGHTWVEKLLIPTSTGFGYTIVWSRELGIFSVYQSGIALYTSNDGFQWILSTVTPPTFDTIPGQLYSWSKELGIFSLGNAISKDGINWIPTGANVLGSTWCAGLGIFCSIANISSDTRYSYDGINWKPGNLGKITSLCTNGSFFVASSVNGFYTSTDGIHWVRSSSFVTGVSQFLNAPIVWADEIGLFVTIYQDNTIPNTNIVAQSRDGINWTILQTFNLSSGISSLCWSGTTFAGVGTSISGVLISPSI